MLFGSVPSPPRNPRSSTSTQSARHSTVPAITPARASRASPRAAAAQNTAPSPATAITANRFTPHPCAAVKSPNQDTSADSTCGCEVPAIVWTMPVSDPGWPAAVPCQNPRPGHACNSAMPRKNTPVPARISRPVRGVSQARSGSATSAPATA